MNDPNIPKGGLWARLFTMNHEPPEKPKASDLELLEVNAVEPTSVEEDSLATVYPVPPGKPIPFAEVVLPGFPAPVAPPVASAVESPVVEAMEEADVVEEAAEVVEEVAVEGSPEVVEAPFSTAHPRPCPACGTKRQIGAEFCHDCGYMFNAHEPEPAPAAALAVPVATGLVAEPVPAKAPTVVLSQVRDYQLRELTKTRGELRRHRGIDTRTQKPVVVVSAPAEVIAPVAQAEEGSTVDEEIMPTFDDVPAVVAEAAGADWPSPAWEKELLERIQQPSFPAVLDQFQEEGVEYLVLEEPQGRSLWDAWDDPDATADARFGWLQQLAEGLHALHQAGAILEGLRADIAILDDNNQPRWTDLSDLLPIPVPPGTPITGSLYTAPELILNPGSATAQADLYSFGAMLYSLEYLRHGLEEKEFERPYVPKQVTDRFPDVHPLFPRILNKTFVREGASRFPTDEASKIDKTGFLELVQNLQVCRKTFDKFRLDIAAWTTTGMVRTGNEDAFHVLHAVEARQDDVYEYALVLLCDGMGGYEAGEVAAAMTIAELKKYLLAQTPFAGLAGKDTPDPLPPQDVESVKSILMAGLKHANKEVFTASRLPGRGKRGMGCTAEAVFLDAGNLLVGHVGDSRTYHLTNGRIKQLTRDQTLVNRLVELGQISEKDAENHDRKNELQQAIGGQPDVSPAVYQARLKRGDWVLVCSDGLSNHISNADLERMLTRETNGSAEEAARRLVNLVNLRGATDNATIVVVRAH